MNQYDQRILMERAKELDCMYAVDEVLQNRQLTLPRAMEALLRVIPTGFTTPKACRVRITLNKDLYMDPDFGDAAVSVQLPIQVGGEVMGAIEVGYRPGPPGAPETPILEEETRLLHTIAERISQLALGAQRELSMLFDMLQRIDPGMLTRICERLRVHLKSVVGEGAELLFGDSAGDAPTYGEVNTPLGRREGGDTLELCKELIAGGFSFLTGGELYDLVSGWVQEERAFSLVKAIDGKDASITDILDAARQYTGAVGRDNTRSRLIDTWLVAELSHRFLTSDEHLLNLVLDNLEIADFLPMLERIIGSPTSMGNIGGKAAGLFIAGQILAHAAAEDPLLADITAPRSWYLAADQIVDFLHYNHLEELNAYKYNSPFHLRMTYDNIVAKIKNARLPPHTVARLSVLLDDFGETPLIVRSSSLLEDRRGAAFSGKYKSLFLVNGGPKPHRLEALIDAVLEVYSSMYNPDAIQYRREREMLHFTEQMGVLIQAVVGRRVGPYFMPVYAGVAFSQNLLRWSARIDPEDGLVRVVMGLGTRAVDRVNDDYPVMFSPGNPGLRINQSPADAKHYSPKQIDLINLETGRFETLELAPLLARYGGEIPGLHRLVSVLEDDFLQSKSAFALRPGQDDMVVTFAGALASTDLAPKLRRMLEVLSAKMQTPVDIEFAFDGERLHLLQCRPQGRGILSEPAPIPAQLPPGDVLFTASRFLPNGALSGITHIVYVDPAGYGSLSTREELLAVGRAVGLLGGLLPRRKYILMGPGRWGSRGDIQLGVRVTYADISATAALIEIAREKQAYLPELSFGTHFFQDLVEADILYLPLYPDSDGVVFQERFFLSAQNLLPDLLPEFAALAPVLRVIDLPACCGGRTLSVHLNADLERGVAFLTEGGVPASPAPTHLTCGVPGWGNSGSGDHWQWRQYMAEEVAAALDMEAMGVRGVYLFGSTNTGSCGMGSDIDLLLHVDDSGEQRHLLLQWLDGWSRALAKINFLRTGYDAEKLLDIHLVTDGDIAARDSFALKINSPTDPATPLRLRQPLH